MGLCFLSGGKRFAQRANNHLRTGEGGRCVLPSVTLAPLWRESPPGELRDRPGAPASPWESGPAAAEAAAGVADPDASRAGPALSSVGPDGLHRGDGLCAAPCLCLPCRAVHVLLKQKKSIKKIPGHLSRAESAACRGRAWPQPSLPAPDPSIPPNKRCSGSPWAEACSWYPRNREGFPRDGVPAGSDRSRKRWPE